MFSPLGTVCVLSASAAAVYVLTLLPQKYAVVTELHERLKMYLLLCRSEWSVR